MILSLYNCRSNHNGKLDFFHSLRLSTVANLSTWAPWCCLFQPRCDNDPIIWRGLTNKPNLNNNGGEPARFREKEHFTRQDFKTFDFSHMLLWDKGLTFGRIQVLGFSLLKSSGTKLNSTLSLSLREAPFNEAPPLFGYCPNSNYIPPPALKRALWGTFFQARFYHFTIFTIFSE